jgi:hypothetical protein
MITAKILLSPKKIEWQSKIVYEKLSELLTINQQERR